MNKTVIFFTSLFIGFIPTLLAAPLKKAFKQPIEINSTYFKHNGKSHKTRYEGEVTLKQGNMKLNADAIEISSTAEGEIISIEAFGAPANFAHSFDDKQKPPVYGKS